MNLPGFFAALTIAGLFSVAQAQVKKSQPDVGEASSGNLSSGANSGTQSGQGQKLGGGEEPKDLSAFEKANPQKRMPLSEGKLSLNKIYEAWHQLDASDILDKRKKLGKQFLGASLLKAFYASLFQLQQLYPLRAQVHPLGDTAFFHHSIKAIRITHPSASKITKRLIVTGGTHAREWSSVFSSLAVAERLTFLARHLPRDLEIFVMPLVNPDGFQYSFQIDPLWRTNLHPWMPLVQGQLLQYFYGVDLARNHGTETFPGLYRDICDDPRSIDDDPVGINPFTCETVQGISSDNPFSSMYRGPHANSEAEAQALQKLLLDHELLSEDIYSINFHNFGRIILRPDDKKSIKLADVALEALPDYQLLPSASIYEMPVHGTFEGLASHYGAQAVLIELGDSFHPQGEELKRDIDDAYAAVSRSIAYIALQ